MFYLIKSIKNAVNIQSIKSLMRCPILVASSSKSGLWFTHGLLCVIATLCLWPLCLPAQLPTPDCWGHELPVWSVCHIHSVVSWGMVSDQGLLTHERLVDFLGAQVSSKQLHPILGDLCEEINPVFEFWIQSMGSRWFSLWALGFFQGIAWLSLWSRLSL